MRGITPREEALGRELRRLREGRRWSQKELAEKLARYGYQWSQPTVTRAESGQRKTSFGEVMALASLFGTTVTEISSRLDRVLSPKGDE